MHTYMHAYIHTGKYKYTYVYIYIYIYIGIYIGRFRYRRKKQMHLAATGVRDAAGLAPACSPNRRKEAVAVVVGFRF